MVNQQAIEAAKASFGKVMAEQLVRIENIKKPQEWTDYSKLKPIKIGILGGDGIGPAISAEAQRCLELLLMDQVKSGKVTFKVIEGMTIENRIAKNAAIPMDVLDEIYKCDVTLKGPTETPEAGEGRANIESANVAMRKYLDLFANVRPVRIPAQNIDWTFFRENTEDIYAVGSQGQMVTPDLAVDYKVISRPGSRRIAEAGFEYAKKNGKKRVTIVTKANVVKTTDGLFLNIAKEVAKNYPGIEMDAWYIDIMTAKLLDTARRSDFQVMVLPNLYGDIITDEAGQIQGGVGTAGSANLGKKYAMFEAIHGSAPRMVKEGRAQYADPSSIIRAGAMMLEHIGFQDLGERLHMALDICGQYEKKLVMTGRSNGAAGKDFGDYVVATVRDSKTRDRWNAYVHATK
ncbi:MAG: isocitrate/isopropylmalate dehydrogenase family protein [Dehalococcoidia bacterium]|nr:isocitrate/isopropylmalate dehydrogenase family protein [Dehalococcoidia bacterium]